MLSLYCLYKLAFSAINIAFDRVGKIDPVTRGFQARHAPHTHAPLTHAQIAAEVVDINVDVHFWSQHVSFILVGVIIVASIRGLLIQVTKVWPRRMLLTSLRGRCSTSSPAASRRT